MNCVKDYDRSTSSARLFKRSLNLNVSSLILLFTAPLWLVIEIAIKLESRGPALYLQERDGMDGHIFQIYKFRSMLDDVNIEDAHRDIYYLGNWSPWPDLKIILKTNSASLMRNRLMTFAFLARDKYDFSRQSRFPAS